MLYGFCSKFHNLSSTEGILNIHQLLAQLQLVKPCAFFGHSVLQYTLPSPFTIKLRYIQSTIMYKILPVSRMLCPRYWPHELVFTVITACRSVQKCSRELVILCSQVVNSGKNCISTSQLKMAKGEKCNELL